MTDLHDIPTDDLTDDQVNRRLKLGRIEKLELENAMTAFDLQDQLGGPDHQRVFTLSDKISPGSVRYAIAQLHQWARVDPGCPITINLTSPGGSIFDGLALYDTIIHLRKAHHVTVVAAGWAASMGGVLLQAGTKRVMTERCYMLIHEASALAGGKTSDIEDEFKLLERLQGNLLDILAERSTMTKRQIKTKWKRKDWWLSADEALALGFIDEVQR